MEQGTLRIACTAVLLAQGLPAAADDGDVARVIVKFRTGGAFTSAAGAAGESATTRTAALGSRLGLAMGSGTTVSDRVQVVFATGLTSAELAERLAREGDVEYAGPDGHRRIVRGPNDPLYAEGLSGNGPAAGQWYLRAPAGDVRSSLDIEPAWALTAGSPQVVVAVLDGGVRYEHPDLLEVAVGGKLLPGYDLVTEAAVANDGDGRDGDASDPGDWVTQAEIAQRGGAFFRCTDSAEPSSWHGTQVAGLVAATTHNGIGMASTAPGVRVLPVRVLGKCGGRDSDIIAGMRWAAGLPVPGVPENPHPARVINLSLGGEGVCSAAYRDAVDEITAAGAVIVAAAGNSSGHAVATPASCPGVIAVAGLRHVGTKVGFSSLGSEVAISAPGGNCVNEAAGSACLYPMLSTTDSGTTVPAGPAYTDSFNAAVGTSFSAPLVAGVAALLLSLDPGLTPAQVKDLLQRTARPFPAPGSLAATSATAECTLPQSTLGGRPVDQLECYCTATTCGAGMLDAAAALAAAEAGTSRRAAESGLRSPP